MSGRRLVLIVTNAGHESQHPTNQQTKGKYTVAFEGMDPDVVYGLGQQLKNQESSLHSIVSAVDGIINQIEGAWKGQDATEFQGWWQQQHRPALLAAAEAVGGLGQSAWNNVNQQRQASGS